VIVLQTSRRNLLSNLPGRQRVLFEALGAPLMIEPFMPHT